jgi:SAM-dependent methyltransferase
MANAPAGDVDYAKIGLGYATLRRPDPRIAALIHAALGEARTVLNVGAGAGSYEPLDRHVIAIEPAAAMRRQRPPHLVPAIHARAEALPLDDQSVDAAMATLTVHQWLDRPAGLRELLRVARGPIVLMIFDPDLADRFWLTHYAPELIDSQRRRDPSLADLVPALSGAGSRRVDVVPVPIAADCTDGFTEAYYARPERFLDPAVTRAQSCWQFVEPAARERFAATLAADLADGRWDARFGHHRSLPVFDGSLRLLVSRPV